MCENYNYKQHYFGDSLGNTSQTSPSYPIIANISHK